MVGGASRASGPTPAAKLNPYPRSRRTLSAFARRPAAPLPPRPPSSRTPPLSHPRRTSRRRPGNAARRPVRHFRGGRMAGGNPERNHRRATDCDGVPTLAGMEARKADHRPPVGELASAIRCASAQPLRRGRVLSRRAPSRVRCLSPQRRGTRSVPPSQCLDARHFREFASVPARNRGTDRESRKLLQKEGLGRWDGWKPRITGERDGGCAVVVATARHNHRGRGVPESARWGMTPTTCTCPGARRSAQNRRYAET